MSNLLGVIVSFGAAICWGLVYGEVTMLDRKIPPIALLSVAYLTGALLLLPIALHQSNNILKSIRYDPGDFFFCLLALVSAEALIFYSISLLGGTEASLIEVSYPLWTGFLLYIIIGEIPTRTTLVGGAFIMVGVVIIVYADRNNKPLPAAP